MFIENAWYIAAWADELDQEPIARTILGQAVVIFRDKSGVVGALEDRCCHRGTPLRFGQVVEDGLQCGYHGLVFNCAGVCVSIPGQSRIPGKAKVRSYPIVERDEFLWIWMGDAEADHAKLIAYQFHNDHKKWPHKHTVYRIRANYKLMVDNLMDMTHLAYVHKSTIGGSNAKVHVDAQMNVAPKSTGLQYIRWMLDCDPPPTYQKAVRFDGKVDRWQEFEFVAPSSIIQWSGALDTGRDAQSNRDQEGGFSLRLFHGLTPETENTCLYFWSASNGYKQDDPSATEQLFAEVEKAFAEDKSIVEAQQATLERTGESGLVDIVSDSARIHMRRTLERLQSPIFVRGRE